MGMKEFKKKNGAFDIKRYFGILIGFSVPVIVIVCSLFVFHVKGDVIWAILGLLITSFFLYILFSPYSEKYYLEYPVLYIKKGRRVSKKSLPPEYSVIVSDMSIMTAIDIIPFAIEDKYYVSIVDSKDDHKTIDILHKGRYNRYSSAIIEERFQYAFFDGFIYDKTIPDVFFENAKTIIIPKSIINRIEHDVLFLPNLVVDEEY